MPHDGLPDVWTYTYRKAGDRLHGYEVDYTRVAEYYKGDPNAGYQAYVFTDFMTAAERVGARDSVERDVRAKLGIPFNPSAPATRYEYSMGQSGVLSAHILRHSESDRPVQA